MQIGRFLDACSPRWRPFFVIALDTGLRRGELVGLQWGDVDLIARVIHVRRSIGYYDQPDGSTADGAAGVRFYRNRARAPLSAGDGGAGGLSTKTDAGRRLVPILAGAQAAFEELYARAKDIGDRAPVFVTVERKPGRDGVVRPAGRPLSPRMVTHVFHRYAERAGLPASVRLHDLRHTAITNAIGQGEDVMMISAFAGHSKASTTLDLYGHLMPERVRQAARRMASISDTHTPPATDPRAPPGS
jgi:integrase